MRQRWAWDERADQWDARLARVDLEMREAEILMREARIERARAVASASRMVRRTSEAREATGTLLESREWIALLRGLPRATRDDDPARDDNVLPQAAARVDLSRLSTEDLEQVSAILEKSTRPP